MAFPCENPKFAGMTHEFLELPAFACIGLEAEGTLHNCQEWLTPHWQACLRRASELDHLPCQGAWGLMRDDTVPNAPWGGERGRYLAGWQVPQSTEPFGDWAVWEVPALHWMRIPCRVDQIGQALEYAHKTLHHHLEWCWEGSVHEFYPTDYHNPLTDELRLMVGMVPR
jgi:hypothetical protein